MRSIIRKKEKSLQKSISEQSAVMMAAERRHIQAHLAFTELRLRLSRNKSSAIKRQRAKILRILHSYWKAGQFPKNYSHPLARRPIFIDDEGTLCAVGYLMAQTGNLELAENLKRDNNYVLVEEVDDQDVNNWLSRNGLTKDEAALIQPGYGGLILERVGYSTQDKLLAWITVGICSVLIVLAYGSLRLLRDTSIPIAKRRRITAAVGVVLMAAAASYLYLPLSLPLPTVAINTLLRQNAYEKGQRISCRKSSFSGSYEGEYASICDDFESSGGKLPGWRVPDCSRKLESPLNCLLL